MTPDFRILADTQDVTAALAARLMELTIEDAAGMESDTVSITLDDREGTITVPRTGAELQVSIGYKETGLQPMGTYVVDEVTLDGFPRKMSIRAHAADLRQKIKGQKTRPWDNISLGGIVATVAAEHGYTPKVAAALAAESFAHLDQVNESDLHFLTRLARDRGAVTKPANGFLLFVPAGEAKSAGGKSLPVTALAAGDCANYSITIAERGKYGKVRARWHDTANAAEQTITVGAGEPEHVISRVYPDAQAATKAAKAKLNALTRGVATVRLTCVGNPLLAAEGKIVLSGFRPGVDGTWLMTRVTHKLGSGGYTCDIDGETPNG